MTSRERVLRALRGEKTDRTPIYGWVSANLSHEIQEKFGSVAAFEDHYGFAAPPILSKTIAPWRI